MSKAVDCDLFIYADGSCLMSELRDVKVIEQNLNNFFGISECWLVTNLTFILGKTTEAISFAQKKETTKRQRS